MSSLSNSTHARLSKLVRENEKKFKKCEFFRLVKKLCEDNEKRLKVAVYKAINRDKLG
ncbi:MAG TPA: hypothetical protein PL089_15420 [Ignavibacteria bacterium]|nr:hypothetical protein [Ignavibacteria bacterium]